MKCHTSLKPVSGTFSQQLFQKAPCSEFLLSSFYRFVLQVSSGTSVAFVLFKVWYW